MKRIIPILAVIMALCISVSCNKVVPETKATTYTVKMNMPTATADAIAKYDITAFEYNEEGEKVANNSISPALYGQSKTFTANSRSVKVKIHVKIYAENSSVTPRYRWVQQVFYLEEGRNIDILLEDTTTVGNSEP